MEELSLLSDIGKETDWKTMGHRKTKTKKNKNKTKNNRTEVETDTHPSAVRVAGELIGQFLNPWTPAPTNGNNELNEPSFYFFTHARPHGLSLSSPSFFFVRFSFRVFRLSWVDCVSDEVHVGRLLRFEWFALFYFVPVEFENGVLIGKRIARYSPPSSRKKNPKKLIHLFKNHRSRSIESETCHLEDAQKNESMIFFTPLLGIGINLT